MAQVAPIRKALKMKDIKAEHGRTNEELIKEHFIDGGKTLEEMADFFGVTISTVWLWMQK